MGDRELVLQSRDVGVKIPEADMLVTIILPTSVTSIILLNDKADFSYIAVV